VVPWLASQGRYDEAQARLDEADRIGANSQLPWAALALGTAHVGLAVWRGDVTDPGPELVSVVVAVEHVLPSIRLLFDVRADDVERTRAFLDTRSRMLATDDFTSIFHLALSAEAAYLVGDAGLAAHAYAALADEAGHVASAGTGVPLGPVDAYLALAAATSGDVGRAAGHADDALALCTKWGLTACEAWIRSRRARGGW
jgi:hypothetical protein